MDYTDILNLWPLLVFAFSFAIKSEGIATFLRVLALLALAAIPETPDLGRYVLIVIAVGLIFLQITKKEA